MDNEVTARGGPPNVAGVDVPAPPTVPGFALETLVRFSRSGETWLARRRADGATASLTLVSGTVTAAAEPMTRFRHPHAVPVTDVVAAGRCVALVSPAPPALTLAAFCAGRPVLDPGEVVTIGLPVARVLAAAHDRDIVHGDLDPVDITIDAHGQPALAGLGVAALSGAGVAPTDDVHALALILRSLLGDDAGPRAEAIRGALSAALSGHPAARPEAAELAGLLSLTCPAQPLRLPPVEPVRRTPAPASGRHGALRHRPSATAVTAALGVLGLLLLVLAAPLLRSGHRGGSIAADVGSGSPGAPTAVPSATGDPRTASAAPTAPASPATPLAPAAPAPTGSPAVERSVPSPIEWQRILQRLVDARDRAFGTLDPAALGGADIPGSSAAAVDGDRLAALRRAKVHASGLTSTVTGVVRTAAGERAAVLSFEESTGPYDLVTAARTVVERRPAQAAQRWSATLVRGPRGWRTAVVEPVAPG